MRNLPGNDLAQELIAASRDEARATPVEDVIAATARLGLGDDAVHRLIGLVLIICLPELSLTIPRSAGFVR